MIGLGFLREDGARAGLRPLCANQKNVRLVVLAGAEDFQLAQQGLNADFSGLVWSPIEAGQSSHAGIGERLDLHVNQGPNLVSNASTVAHDCPPVRN